MPAAAIYPILHAFASDAKERLVAENYGPLAVSQREVLKQRLSDTASVLANGYLRHSVRDSLRRVRLEVAGRADEDRDLGSLLVIHAHEVAARHPAEGAITQRDVQPRDAVGALVHHLVESTLVVLDLDVQIQTSV